MSKREQAILDEIADELDNLKEYEEWQFEYSYETAQAFVEQTMDELYDYDIATDDENYIPGCATYGLFIALIPKLAEMGYTIDDIKREIEENMAAPASETLH